MEKYITLKCPYCKWEYLPSEIFYPESVIGTANVLKRDASGAIEAISGKCMETYEEYTCDNCGKQFHLLINTSFSIYKSKPRELEKELKQRAYSGSKHQYVFDVNTGIVYKNQTDAYRATKCQHVYDLCDKKDVSDIYNFRYATEEEIQEYRREHDIQR